MMMTINYISLKILLSNLKKILSNFVPTVNKLKQSKEKRCVNVCTFTQKVILGANQAFLMWFQLINFTKTGKEQTFVSMLY
jgi:hypothetical protein